MAEPIRILLAFLLAAEVVASTAVTSEAALVYLAPRRNLLLSLGMIVLQGLLSVALCTAVGLSHLDDIWLAVAVAGALVAALAYWTLRAIDGHLDHLSRRLINLSYPEEARALLEKIVDPAILEAYLESPDLDDKPALKGAIDRRLSDVKDKGASKKRAK